MEEQRPNGGLTVGIRFRPSGKIYEFDPGPLILARDDRVLVETERGPSLGTVVVPPRPRTTGGLQRVIKKADARDLAREDQNLQREHQHERVALELIRSRELPVKLVKAESAFDGSKVTFFLSTGDDRVDVRELGRDLAQRLATRVETKQIGARDETKITGGVGPCGRELCCSTWLREFQAVSVRMAKEQGLSLNPSKLSGMCGRLKCCLRYEYDTYLELRRELPKVGAKVTSLKGDGVVLRHNVLKQTAIVRRAEDAVEVEVTLEDLVEKRAD